MDFFPDIINDIINPEQQNGNIEYKLKLEIDSDHKIQQLASQMKYRCSEGNSECIYNLGITDEGIVSGISEDEYNKTIEILTKTADKNNYYISLLNSKKVSYNKNIYQVLVREKNDNNYIDIRVAVAGSVDSGKSSTLSCLINGILDDGRGSARVSVFNYPHEVKTGRTSSIGHHIIGYNEKGEIVNYNSICSKMSWPDIVKNSSKIINLLDLAGHEKYLKTTILGLSSSLPELCLIIVGANRGIIKMTLEHVFLCITLKIPFAFVVTKIDMVKDKQNILEDTLASIIRLLKCPGIQRIPVKVENNEDIITCAKNIATESIVPIFQISNVTGQGHDNLRQFLNLIEKKKNHNISSDNVEFHIDSSWSITGIGTVVGGFLVSGTVKVGDKLFFGPINGNYEQVTIRSIQCKRVPLQKIDYSTYVCFGIKKLDRNLVRKGRVIVSNNNKILCKTFTANIRVLKSHSTTIRTGYEPIIHVHTMRQRVKLIDIQNKHNTKNQTHIEPDNNILRTGDTATVTFYFDIQPEFVKSGMNILLCEGITKVVGTINEIL
jgi:GTPase